MLAPLKLGKFSVIFLVLLPTMALMLIFVYQDYTSTMTKIHQTTYKNFLHTTEQQFYSIARYLHRESGQYAVPHEAATDNQKLLALFLSDTITGIALIEKKGNTFQNIATVPKTVDIPDIKHLNTTLMQSYTTQKSALFTKNNQEYLLIPVIHETTLPLLFVLQLNDKPFQQIEAIINPLNELSFTITLLLIVLLVIAYIRLFFLYRQRDDGVTDPTTQVFSRRYYHEVMKTLDANYYQIILLRINDFTAIKTRYDHEITDIILQSVASRILRVTRRQDIFVHFEGATFIVFYKRKKDEKADILASRISESISKQPIIAEGLYINIDLQIVINRHPETKKSLQEAIEEAQEELQHIETNSVNAEEHGRFNSSKKSRIIFELQEALKEHRINPMFQPIYTTDDMSIHAYELFARIVTPEQEIIRANHFIDLIIDDPVAIALDTFMLHQAVELIKKHHVTLHLNIHVTTLCHDAFMETLQEALRNAPAIATYLCMEINGLNHRNTITKEQIKKQFDLIKSLHVHIALDNVDIEAIDFKEILYLGPDMLKLDYITVNNDTYKLIQLSKNMNIDVVVKTIQSEKELLYAQQSGAKFLQGYFLDEPDFTLKEH